MKNVPYKSYNQDYGKNVWICRREGYFKEYMYSILPSIFEFIKLKNKFGFVRNDSYLCIKIKTTIKMNKEQIIEHIDAVIEEIMDGRMTGYSICQHLKELKKQVANLSEDKVLNNLAM